ncbi:phosphotransferase [Streptomyces sp. NPDC002306]
MPLESTSIARRRAVEVSGDESVVQGPLLGYHHETYVFSLPDDVPGAGGGRWKCREPRTGLLWFDRRCFFSEEQLLSSLADRISGIPDIIEVGGIRLQRFIEGRTLAALCRSGSPVPDTLFRQIVDLFGQMVDVTSETLLVKRRCKPEDFPEAGDSNGFLERLICFAEEHVYLKNLEQFEVLFGELGIDVDSFKKLRKHVSGLKERPFSLLHADLHGENFIVDFGNKLWTIDWELAMMGDPLYDLATHLYLMRYPRWQERRMVREWRSAVETFRPGASHGLEHDLPLLLDYKRAQSVFTDVIREALSLDAGPEPYGRRIAPAGRKLRDVMAAASGPLGLDAVPTSAGIGSALMRWRRSRKGGEDAGSR